MPAMPEELDDVFQVHPHGISEVFPDLMLRHPEMFSRFTLHDGRLPTNQLHPVDENL